MLRLILPATLVIVLLHSQTVLAPEYQEPEKMHIIQEIYGPPAPIPERRKMRVTAYTAHDRGMNGRGITASGEKVREGHIAAPKEIPFGTQIFIPDLNQTFVVTDRGGAIRGNRLDVYIPDKKLMEEFGVKEMEVEIRK